MKKACNKNAMCTSIYKEEIGMEIGALISMLISLESDDSVALFSAAQETPAEIVLLVFLWAKASSATAGDSP